MATIIGRDKLTWRKHLLFCYGRPDPIAEVVPDGKYPGMWRLRLLPDGNLSDMVNLSRAKDAAIARALGFLNGKKRAPDTAPAGPDGGEPPG